MDKAQAKPNEKLLTEFDVPSYEEWKVVVESLLKGKPFEKAMFTKTYEDIVLQPIYRMEDVAELEHMKKLPGEDGNPRSPKTSGYLNNSWSVGQEQTDYLPSEVNKSLLEELSRGITKVNLRADDASRNGKNPHKLEGVKRYVGTSISTLEDLKTVLNGVFIENIEVDINAGIMAPAYLGMFKEIAKERNIDFSQLTGCIGLDPINCLASDGELKVELKEALNYMACMTDWAVKNNSAIKTILIDTCVYADRGANINQELAIALNTAVYYINEMLDRKLAIQDILAHIQFNLSIGQKFFLEIAKFRSFRLLFDNLVKAYQEDLSLTTYIHAIPSKWNKTKYDPYVNVLRTATESFSAVLGGIDSLAVSHLDELLARPTAFTRRIARNQQIILNEEANLYKVIDPAGGSWYIEKMTAEIAESAWEQFQTYEAEGGIIASLTNGIIQDDVIGIANEKIKNVATRKDVFIGSNMFANLEEKAIDFDEADFDSKIDSRIKKIYDLVNNRELKQTCNCAGSCGGQCDCSSDSEKHIIDDFAEFFVNGGTIGECFGRMYSDSHGIKVDSITNQRVTTAIEELRSSVESMTETPKVYLANFGSIPTFKARADFAKGFFEVGALDVVTSNGYQDIDSLVDATIEANCPSVCICSTDANYVEIIPSFVAKLKEKAFKGKLIVAGYPKEHVESFKEAGIDEFIHVRANCYGVLKNLLEKAGE